MSFSKYVLENTNKELSNLDNKEIYVQLLNYVKEEADKKALNSDKKKRVFTFSTDVTIPAKEENKPQPQPNPDKDKPQPDKNKPDRDKPQPDKNKPDTKPTKDKDLEQPNSDGDLQFKSKQDQPRKDDTKSTTNKQEDKDGKKEVKKALPNTGEATSILGVIGAVLAFVGAGLVAKRKRG